MSSMVHRKGAADEDVQLVWVPVAEICFDASISGRLCDLLNGVLNAAVA